MAETLEKDGNRIDRASQVILRALNGGDEWVRGKTLREAADLSQNGQVFYRMEEHLIPSGLTQEAARTERNGRVEPRQFRLTEEGGGVDRGARGSVGSLDDARRDGSEGGGGIRGSGERAVVGTELPEEAPPSEGAGR